MAAQSSSPLPIPNTRKPLRPAIVAKVSSSCDVPTGRTTDFSCLSCCGSAWTPPKFSLKVPWYSTGMLASLKGSKGCGARIHSYVSAGISYRVMVFGPPMR